MDRRFQNHRQSSRLQTFDYSSSGAYFVTVCAQPRGGNLLGEVTRDGMQPNAAGEMVARELVALPFRFTNLELDVFIVMPDHIHTIFVLRKTTNHAPDPRRGEPCVRPATQPSRSIPPNQTVRGSRHNQDSPLEITLPAIGGGDSRVAQGDHKDRPYVHPTGTEPGSVGRIVQAFKSITTHQYIQGVRESNWQPFEKRFWERNYWERVLRNDTELEEKRRYILTNPERFLERRGAV